MRSIRKIVRVIIWNFQEGIVYFFRFAIIRMSTTTLFTYENSKKQDGVGAQVQRIFAIYTLCNFFQLGYIHSPIKSVAIHPLDSYQNQKELKQFLVKLNDAIELKKVRTLKYSTTLIVESINIYKLFKILLIDKFMGRTTLVKIVEPYSIVDHFPNQYSCVSKALVNDFFKIHDYANGDISNSFIVIHHRRGVGGFVIQSGESIPREIEFDYYKRVLSKILKSLPSKKEVNVKILSDSPDEDFFFVPSEDQKYLWKDTPRYEKGRILIKGMRIKDSLNDLGVRSEYIVGGDPLDALRIMSQAHFLIMSRSSLSYVGAILNGKGTVVFEKSFWHKPMTPWIIEK